jgi:hypothetical protein
MHRLLSFPAEEEKPVSVMAENFGHRGQKSAEGMAARRGKSGLALVKAHLVAAATYLRCAAVHQASVSASLRFADSVALTQIAIAK